MKTAILTKWRYPLLIGVMACLVLVFVLIIKTASKKFFAEENDSFNNTKQENLSWLVPDPDQIARNPDGELIRYGRELIINTSSYLGPKGRIAAISNGMNCQNCHLDAGTRFWATIMEAYFLPIQNFVNEAEL